MAREAMGVCLRVLKESNKSRFDSYSVRKSVLIISHITFRDCRVHSFPTTFLEIAVYGEAKLTLARTNPLPFYIPFFKKKVQCTSFVYLLLTNGTPLYIPCLELCTLFNCCKCTAINHKNRTISRLYKAINFIC